MTRTHSFIKYMSHIQSVINPPVARPDPHGVRRRLRRLLRARGRFCPHIAWRRPVPAGCLFCVSVCPSRTPDSRPHTQAAWPPNLRTCSCPLPSPRGRLRPQDGPAPWSNKTKEPWIKTQSTKPTPVSWVLSDTGKRPDRPVPGGQQADLPGGRILIKTGGSSSVPRAPRCQV